MKNYFSLFLFFALLGAFTGCKDKEETIPGIDFDITFKAVYDGDQLEANKPYFLGPYSVEFVRHRLYLSDITLYKEDGTQVVLSTSEYLDFTPDSSSTEVSVTPRITFKNVPEGSYDGIKMGFGVKPSDNAKRPSNFPAGHPLNIEIDYWLGWKSYIFMILDGRGDTDGDGINNLNFSYHCGSDPVYQTFSFDEHIHVENGHVGMNVTFDIRKLLTNTTGTYFDILANPATSNNIEDDRIAKELMSHYKTATNISQ
jgi:hypothetical protein